MKKRIFGILTFIVCLLFSVVLVGCGDDDKTRTDKFIGSYSSIWVERLTNVDPAIEPKYDLIISADKTFILKHFRNDIEQWSIDGNWKSNKSNDEVGIICLASSYTSATSGYENPNRKYFTLMELDDGSFLASTGVVSIFYGGSGSIVIFAKN